MTLDEISAFNADWLKAWTDKDAARVASFYSDDCRYMDPNTAGGLQGNAVLRGYLDKMFAAAPDMTYTPDEVWPIPGGFCGRWYADVQGGARLRGFDFVLLKDGKIAHNEVYLHTL
jgi:hypothetical protein